ncbi:MAG: FAD-dependent oxidoreductase [Acidobacteriota bacterium]|jgi:thioredoxin reductase (NADPH)|nr:FAD-dependent oxidoreductase [Acidobacteriota bacterium]
MAKPVLLTVDDDSDVLHSIERDLRRQYAQHYRIVSAGSGTAALDLLRRLQRRNEPLALLLVDHRMPQMTGIEFLKHALQVYPDAKRVLLTAYADTDAAIQAINEIKLHHYLLKPWTPPENNLYPVLDDLLDEWQAAFRPAFEGIRLLGTRWSPQSYALREFLARNHVPYQWLDVEAAERDAEVRRALQSVETEDIKLPVLLFPDGERIAQPDPSQIADRIGLRTRSDQEFYDLVILGGGPAGLAAAVYGASEGLRTVVVERDAPGGQAGLSSRIENYLGFPSGLSGADLTRRAVAQAKRFGADILAPQRAVALQADGSYRVTSLQDGGRLSSHAVLIATGVQWRKLNVPGADRLTGAGIYYGAGAFEAASCKDEDVFVIGGANSAGQAAMNFAGYARRVIMLVRGESLSTSMSKYLIDECARKPNIEVQYGVQLVEAHGADRLEAISVRCDRTGEVDKTPAFSVFVFIGAEPGTDWLEGVVARDGRGFILTGPDLFLNGQRPKGWLLDRDPTLLETSLPGVFAVGDVRHGSVKRVASGVGEGSIAIQFVHQYLAKV